MIKIDIDGMTDEAAQKHIRQACLNVGPVKRIEVFRPSASGGGPYVAIYMAHPNDLDLLIKKFGGYIFDSCAIIGIDAMEVPLSLKRQ